MRSSRQNLSEQSLSLIRDSDVRKQLLRELELQRALQQVAKELREAGDKKDSILRELQPQEHQRNIQIEEDITRLMDEKDKIYRSMDQLRESSHSISTSRDEIKKLDFDVSTCNREIQSSKKELEELRKHVKELEQERAAFTAQLTYRSMSEALEEIERLESELEVATVKGNTQLINALAKQKATAERAKKNVAKSYAMDDRLIEMRKKTEQAEEKVEKKILERQLAEDQRKELREKVKGAGDITKQLDEGRARIRDINAEISKAKESRQKKKKPQPQGEAITDPMDETNASIRQLRADREAIVAELGELGKTVHTTTCNVNPQFKGDIIGHNGATLNQLQQDFGCLIDFSRDEEKTLILTGGQEDCAAAIAAIEAIVENAEKNRQTKTIPFDNRLSKSFIGVGGSNISRIQKAAGIGSIKIRSEKNAIELVGTVESIDAATKLINEFIDNNASETLSFDPKLRDILIGKGGETVNSIQQKSGARRINIDRDKHVINIQGSRDAVAKAKEAYEELIEGMSKNVFTLRADDRMIGRIIGPRGKTIREIQEASHAIISTSGTTVTIRGPQEAIDTARKLIEDITRRDEIKIPFDPLMFDILVSPEENEDVKVEAAAGSPDEEEKHIDPTKTDMTISAETSNFTPLRRIQMQSGCDQVSAIKSESKVVIRGRKECVNQARLLLSTFLQAAQPSVVAIPCKRDILVFLTKRLQGPPTGGAPGKRGKSAAATSVSIADLMREKYGQDVRSMEFDREGNILRIAADSAKLETPVAHWKNIVTVLNQMTSARNIQASQVRLVIGPQGSTILGLQESTRTEISLDKEKNVVSALAPPQDIGFFVELCTPKEERKDTALLETEEIIAIVSDAKKRLDDVAGQIQEAIGKSPQRS